MDETTRGYGRGWNDLAGNGIGGAKRLRVENRGETTRGETTRGEMSWGRNVLLPSVTGFPVCGFYTRPLCCVGSWTTWLGADCILLYSQRPKVIPQKYFLIDFSAMFTRHLILCNIVKQILMFCNDWKGKWCMSKIYDFDKYRMSVFSDTTI